jgi:hypothetical protein
VTPEEALGRLSADLGDAREPEVAIVRQALEALSWYLREYPIAHRIATETRATETRATVQELRREYDAHDRRCRWGGR